MRQYSDAKREEIIGFIPTQARRVLDVGCHQGGFGHALAAARPEIVVWGIEPDPESARVAATRLQRVIEGSYPSAALRSESFDCIVFNDVLEHMEDPEAALLSATDNLAPTGVVVASIPNVRHFTVVAPLVLKGRWDYRSGGILDRTHLRFFTRATMTEMFERCGYTVRSCTPINVSPATGKIARLMHFLGSRGIEFLAIQYVIVAVPTSEKQDVNTST